jgi:hypothetical protein
MYIYSVHELQLDSVPGPRFGKTKLFCRFTLEIGSAVELITETRSLGAGKINTVPWNRTLFRLSC